MSEQKFMVEVIDRLARIETTLAGLAASGKADMDACQRQSEGRFKVIEDDLREIQEEKKWLWRALMGIALVAAYDLVKGLVVVAMN
ncbi:MAG: hypothetical protein AB1815_02530 [Bacillota bacterium]